ncbi:hypothetical protein [Paenibacillus taichungensis]|uniref:hypothetical protein n=1 Tax=Paenibacillus taichungensis TaxID=484184 RepID=UPI0015EB3202|nr:hypothetical protein [Paenibacillus taichungensis]
MNLPINKTPAQPSSQDGKAARGFVVWLTVQPDPASEGTVATTTCLMIVKTII